MTTLAWSLIVGRDRKANIRLGAAVNTNGRDTEKRALAYSNEDGRVTLFVQVE